MNPIKSAHKKIRHGFKVTFISKNIQSDKKVKEFADEINNNTILFTREFSEKLRETHTNIICTANDNHIELSTNGKKESAYISVKKAKTYSSDDKGYSGTFFTNLLISTHNNQPIFQFIPAISWTCNECAIKRKLRVANTTPTPEYGQNIEIPMDNY
ncbi:hypothetical protein [Iodobacter fluviatilis]|uniref:Uncharacterized protein n=1 Tax=Iodobacter fluviatilis TaxID=537 RepID=A0A377Q942_9NEIS|nr:hypothetical protein [Iodobacter fluviatilis]TCU88496.1 hypothetical protein EV682_10379 [Iodobacter fluviatilis]STQ91433.1 Uncharacterised protein [Iodobacter fluviatilis]